MHKRAAGSFLFFIVGTFSRRKPSGSGWTKYQLDQEHPHSRPHTVPRSGDFFKPKTARSSHQRRRAGTRPVAVRLFGKQAELGAAKDRSVANRAMSIFGAAYDVSADRWVAFNEDTLTSLSEHDTEAEALDACRRYTEREMRRGDVLHHLSFHAI